MNIQSLHEFCLIINEKIRVHPRNNINIICKHQLTYNINKQTCCENPEKNVKYVVNVSKNSLGYNGL